MASRVTHAGDIQCDTREPAVVYSVERAAGRMAHVRLRAKRSSVDAPVGAKLILSAPNGWVRYQTVYSAQAFQSQNSFWLPLALGPHAHGLLSVVWPGSGQRISFTNVSAGDRIFVDEP